MKKAVKESPKTTAGGIAVAVVALIAVLKAQFDGDVSTVPNWDGLVTAVIVAGTLIFGAGDHK